MLLKLIRCRQHYYIENFQDWMREPLSGKVKRRASVTDEKTGKQKAELEEITVPCYSLDETTNECLFLAGLLDKFIAAAKKRGYEVETVDGRMPNPMDIKPDYDKIPQSLRHKQDEAINAIINNDKGIIKCGTGFGKSFIMTNICMIYPKARIVIVTASKVVVKQTYESLKNMIGTNEVGLLCGGTNHLEDNKRVTVCTCASVLRAPLATCDILFFDEVHNCGFNKVFDNLVENVGNSRMYGLTASLNRGDGALDAIKALFGKIIVECSYQEAVEHKMVTPLKVIMPEMRMSRPIDVVGVQHVDERRNYWQNHERNRFFAEASLDVPEDKQLIITVKTVEHAVYLMKHPELANYEVIHGGSVEKSLKKEVAHRPDTIHEPVKVVNPVTGKEEILTPAITQDGRLEFRDERGFVVTPIAAMKYKDVNTGKYLVHVEEVPNIIGGVDVSNLHRTKRQINEQHARLASGEIKRAIVTTALKEGGNFYHIEYIFRADGSTSGVINVQFPGRASRVLESKPMALILDPYDNWNDWVRWRSERRKGWYRDNGWI